MTNTATPVEVADLNDEPITYRKRVRDYYFALGYQVPYRWAHYRDVPFSAMQKPLSQSSVAIVTTAAPFDSEAGDQGPAASYNGRAKFYSVYELPSADQVDLRISHIAYDREHTAATDLKSWFPLKHLQSFAAQGVIGEVASSFYGLPTNRSHRTTIEIDAPEIVSRVQNGGADVCILVPNCPVCHQSVGIAARQLEASGIPTVVMGCAKDIVEYVGVPRFMFSDFPLGNSAGKPHDEQSQIDTLVLALQTLVCAPAARTTVQSTQCWGDDPSWKADYCRVDNLCPQQKLALRAEFDRQKDVARGQR